MSYNYKINAGRYGGEHIIGTIPNSVGQYWLNKGNQQFEDYFFSWNKDEDYPNIPQKFALEDWYEIDDIMHESTVEFADTNYFEITNKKTNKSFYIDFSEINKDSISVDLSSNDTILKSKKTIVFAQSFEKGSYEISCYDKEGRSCDFITDEPFDVNKIKNVNLIMWSNLLLLNGFEYEDYSFEISGGDSIGKSMTAWLHSTNGTKIIGDQITI